MAQQLHSATGTHLSGLISERGPGRWRAIAWIREADLALKQTIGPKTLATISLAHRWLNQVATEHGFQNFNIVVERLGDEGLLVESINPEVVEENLVAVDVDA